MRLAPLALAALLVGCFDPKFEEGFFCGDPNLGPSCPGGLYCASDGTCRYEEPEGPAPDGGTPMTPEAVHVGLMIQHPVAARIGDDVVVAGLFSEPGGGEPRFEMVRFNRDGKRTESTPLPELVGVEPETLRATGTNEALVIAGMTGTELRHVWLTRDGVSPLVETQNDQVFTTFADDAIACLARSFTPTLGERRIEAWCSDGFAYPEMQVIANEPAPPAAALGGAVSDFGGTGVPEVVIAIDEKPVGGPDHGRVLHCPGTAAPTPLGGQYLPSGTLQPQVAYFPEDDLIGVAWRADGGFLFSTHTRICGPVTGEQRWDMLTSDFALASRPGIGDLGNPRMWALVVNGQPDASPILVSAFPDWGGTQVSVGHRYLQTPRAITDGDGRIAFFLHAAEDPGAPGYIKVFSPTNPIWSGPDDPQAVGSETALADFAVAPRWAGGAFVVFRDNPEHNNPDLPLDTYLVVLDKDGTPLAPPAP